jgi:hypothetical protein
MFSILLVFVCEGGYLGIYPAITSYIFGLKSGGKVFSFIMGAIGLSSLLGFILTYHVISIEKNYAIFYWATAMSAGALVLLAFFN